MKSQSSAIIGGPDRPDADTMAEVIGRLVHMTRLPYIAKFTRLPEQDLTRILDQIVELWDDDDTSRLLCTQEFALHAYSIFPDSILQIEILPDKIAAMDALIARDHEEITWNPIHQWLLKAYKQIHTIAECSEVPETDVLRVCELCIIHFEITLRKLVKTCDACWNSEEKLLAELVTTFRLGSGLSKP